MSEAVFRDVLTHLPQNGPSGQEGLSYWVRRNDLLLVFVNTLSTGLGGEGYVETDWLREVLHRNADASHKLVIGLQVCTAGAGTAHRMPEDVEDLHCVQAATDAEGLRYQVIDVEGRVREELSWPVILPPTAQWHELPAGRSPDHGRP